MSLKSIFDVGWWEFESSCFYVVDKFGGGMWSCLVVSRHSYGGGCCC